jgi:hypothetical protein
LSTISPAECKNTHQTSFEDTNNNEHGAPAECKHASNKLQGEKITSIEHLQSASTHQKSFKEKK